MSFSILEQQYVVTIPLISLEATQLEGNISGKEGKSQGCNSTTGASR